jgi:hypothetical protein
LHLGCETPLQGRLSFPLSLRFGHRKLFVPLRLLNHQLVLAPKQLFDPMPDVRFL